MENENRVTLLQLAEHLEIGTCIHERFDFSLYNNLYTNGNIVPNCGTAGCALGEMPALDKRWGFDVNENLCLDGIEASRGDIQNYFNLEKDELLHLFYPESQNIYLFNGKRLTDFSKKYEVADNIREFVKITGKN